MRLFPLLGAAALIFVSAAASRAQTTDDPVPNATYETIQQAIDAAATGNGGTITVRAGTYTDQITLRSNVILRGEETARTILSGGVTSEGGGTLRRFTILGSGAVFSGVSNLEIANNVFRGTSGTALSLQRVTGATLTNNTFYGNGTAVSVSGGTATVKGNLFAQNDTAVSRDDNSDVTFSRNFFDLANQDPTQGTQSDRDPLLVNPQAGDVHLTTDSPCRNAALDSSDKDTDQGAYGGDFADTRPFPVSGVDATDADLDGNATVVWQANNAYDITGYRVYFGSTTAYAGIDADQGTSPVSVGLVTTLHFTGLPVETEPPETVQNLRAFPRDKGVFLEWDPAARATGYRVLWGLADGASLDHQGDAGSTTAFTVSGLANNEAYRFAILSLGGTTHHFAVTALADGVESALSADASFPVNPLEGDLSTQVTQTPEQVAGFPLLDDRGGCFVHAAASGGARSAAPWITAACLVLAVLLLSVRFRRHALLLGLALALAAAPARAEGPRWSAEVKGGVLVPGESGWGDHYDSSLVPDWRVGLGFRPFSQVEVGVEGGFRRSTGTVDTTQSGQPLGQSLDQTLTVIPIQVFAVYDFRARDDQLLVPYLGLGYSRYYYRHEVDGGDSVRGSQHGYHARAGLKVLLNRFDPSSARKARANLGLARTYLGIEGQYARVDDFGSADADLGGWSMLVGACVDF